MSNPFAALFEDVDTSTDPMLAEMDLTDGPFAPLAPPAPPVGAPPAGAQTAKPKAKAAEPPKPTTSQSAVHEMLSPPVRGGSPKKSATIQQALVVTWEKGEVPNLIELNDLLASGWRVATTAGFPTADGSRGSLLVVVEM